MNFSPLEIVALVAAGIAAGFVNTIAGGGSFFSFPLLVLLGFPPQVANGTIRVTIVMQNLVAVPTYAKSGHFYPKESLLIALVAVPAALFGARAAVALDAEQFRMIASVLLLVVLATLFIRPRAWGRTEPRATIRWAIALPAIALVGAYGGFFQLGAGVPFLAAAVLGGGWDLVSANAIKVTVILLYTSVALVVFGLNGQVDWVAGVLLGAGNMLGAWIGAKMAVKQGPGWIRWVLVAMAVVAVVKMLRG